MSLYPFAFRVSFCPYPLKLAHDLVHGSDQKPTRPLSRKKTTNTAFLRSRSRLFSFINPANPVNYEKFWPIRYERLARAPLHHRATDLFKKNVGSSVAKEIDCSCNVAQSQHSESPVWLEASATRNSQPQIKSKMFSDPDSPTKFLWDLDIRGKIKENLLVEYGSDGGVGFEGALDDVAITESQRRAKLIFVQCYANCERRVQTPLGIPRNQQAGGCVALEQFSFSLDP